MSPVTNYAIATLPPKFAQQFNLKLRLDKLRSDLTPEEYMVSAEDVSPPMTTLNTAIERLILTNSRGRRMAAEPSEFRLIIPPSRGACPRNHYEAIQPCRGFAENRNQYIGDGMSAFNQSVEFRH